MHDVDCFIIQKSFFPVLYFFSFELFYVKRRLPEVPSLLEEKICIFLKALFMCDHLFKSEVIFHKCCCSSWD